MLVQYSALVLKEREDRFARRQKKLNEKHRAYISTRNVGKKKEWREISRKLPLKKERKKGSREKSHSPCERVKAAVPTNFPRETCPFTLYSPSPATNLLPAVQNEIYSKRNDPGERFKFNPLLLSLSFESSYILLRIICGLKMLIRLSFSGRAANFNYSDRRIGRIIVAKKTRGSKAHNRFVLILLTHLECSCTFLRLEADAMCIRAFIRDLHSRREACLYVFFLLTRI